MPSARRRASLPRRSAIRRLSSEASGEGVGSFMAGDSVVVAYVVDYRAPEGVSGDVIEDFSCRVVRARELFLLVKLQEAVDVREVAALARTNVRLHGGVDDARGKRCNTDVGMLFGQHSRVVVQGCLGRAVDRPAACGLAARSGRNIRDASVGFARGATQKGRGEHHGRRDVQVEGLLDGSGIE